MISWKTNTGVRTVGSWLRFEGVWNIAAMTLADLRECISQMSPEDRAKLEVPNEGLKLAIEGLYDAMRESEAKGRVEIESQRATIERLNRELESFLREAEETQKVLAATQRTLGVSQVGQESMAQENVNLRNELSEIKSRYEAEKDSHEGLMNRLVTMGAELDKERVGACYLDGELKTAREVIARLENELAESNEPCSSCAKDRRRLEEKLTDAEKRIVELEAKATVLPDWLAACPDELVDELKALVKMPNHFNPTRPVTVTTTGAIRALSDVIEGMNDAPNARRLLGVAAMRCLSAAAAIRKHGTL